MSEQRVQLYVYDLTKGLAAQLSPLFLGKQIEGVWHTGVVVYGTEYFFGGLGIEYTSPGTLPMLGSPDKKVDLGSTSIPEDVFMDYLYDISSQYFPETYHLLEHNCNHFSNEVAQFLTGNKIPSYISDPAQGSHGNSIWCTVTGFNANARTIWWYFCFSSPDINL
eukprot:Em0021g730a